MNENENGTASSDAEEAVEIEDEDDFTGYFLEPIANSVNMVERIAEANRKLYEDDDSEKENSERPKKVQFSESLINYEPETYESEEFDDSENDDEKLEELGKNVEKKRGRPKTARRETKEMKEGEDIVEEIKEHTIPEEVEDDVQDAKVLLVMLPREQSSSCESIIGEEILGETKPEVDKPKPECQKDEEGMPEGSKPAKANNALAPSPCKISKISFDSKCSSKADTKKQRVTLSKSKEGELKKEGGRLESYVEGQAAEERAKTAADRRSCCIVRTGLPQYNGLRSEYGLSAEQLQERRRRTAELRQQRRVDRMKKKQEEIRRKLENEECFSQWLCNKRRGTIPKRPTQVDTLSRSDVYIQTHAVYASRRGVSYAVEYGFTRKKLGKTPRMLLDGKPDKSINLEKLFDNVSPHVKHTYRIFIGGMKK